MIGRRRLLWLFGLLLVGITLCMMHQSSGWRHLLASAPGQEAADISDLPVAPPLAPQHVTMEVAFLTRHGLCYEICVKTKSDGQTWPGLKVSYTVTSGPTKGQKCSGVTDKNGFFCCTICSEGSIGGIDKVGLVCEDATGEVPLDWGVALLQNQEELKAHKDCGSCEND